MGGRWTWLRIVSSGITKHGIEMHAEFWVGKPEETECWGKFIHRWKENIKMIVKEVGWGAGLYSSGLSCGLARDLVRIVINFSVT
jgi:hypothetical protein